MCNTVSNDGFLDHVRGVGKYLHDGIVACNFPQAVDLRGTGLLQAIQFNAPIAKKIVQQGYNNGLLLNAPNENTIRLAPPLIIDYPDIDIFLDRFTRTLCQACSSVFD